MDFGYKQLYIGGDLRDAYGGERRDVVCPGNGERVGEVAWAGMCDAELALDSAQRRLQHVVAHCR